MDSLLLCLTKKLLDITICIFQKEKMLEKFYITF